MLALVLAILNTTIDSLNVRLRSCPEGARYAVSLTRPSVNTKSEVVYESVKGRYMQALF